MSRASLSPERRGAMPLVSETDDFAKTAVISTVDESAMLESESPMQLLDLDLMSAAEKSVQANPLERLFLATCGDPVLSGGHAWLSSISP